jgi:hypothetical protein
MKRKGEEKKRRGKKDKRGKGNERLERAGGIKGRRV